MVRGALDAEKIDAFNAIFPKLIAQVREFGFRIKAGSCLACRIHAPPGADIVVATQVGTEIAESWRGGNLSRDTANFTGLVLGCIETKFCKKICV